jgi:cytochrome c5
MWGQDTRREPRHSRAAERGLRRVSRLTLAMALLAGLGVANPVHLPDGEGRKVVEAACGSCHGLELVTTKRLSNHEWQEIVNAMIDRGAALTRDQAVSVVGYLAKNFGRKDRGRELVEDVCTYCHSLNKLSGHELSREEWRDLIAGMIFEGAPVTDEEFSLILDYLTKNFGIKDP